MKLYFRQRKADKVVNCSKITDDEWHQYRRTGIGGSDAAICLGLSKFKTPMDLYYAKVSPQKEDVSPEKQYLFDFGHAMEEFVAKHFEKVFMTEYKDEFELNFSQKYQKDIRISECRVYRDTWMYRSPEHPFMIADLDFLVDFTLDNGKVLKGVFECKTTNPQIIRKTWQEQAPPYYVTQTRHYMAVTDLMFTVIACAADNNSNNYYVHIIHRDEDEENALIEKEEKFWNENVLEQKPPFYSVGDNTKLLLNQINTDLIGDEVVCDNSPTITDLLSKYESVTDNITFLNTQLKELNTIKAQITSDITCYLVDNNKYNINVDLPEFSYQLKVESKISKAVDYNKFFKDCKQEFSEDDYKKIMSIKSNSYKNNSAVSSLKIMQKKRGKAVA